MQSNHFILCHPLLLLPSILAQHQGLFQWVSSSHQVANTLFGTCLLKQTRYSGIHKARFLSWRNLGTDAERANLVVGGEASGAAWQAILMAQLVKNPPAMQETLVKFLGQEIHWRRDRLPTPVFFGFLCGSAGKESSCNAGDLGSIPGLGLNSPGVQLIDIPLEKGTATHSSILAWRIPWTV